MFALLSLMFLVYESGFIFSKKCNNVVFCKYLYELGLNIDIFLTAIGLPPSDSSTVHIYTQTVHKTKNT